MIKLTSLEYFILNITAFLCGVIIFYNLPSKWLFLLLIVAVIPKFRLPTIFMVFGFMVVFLRMLNLEIEVPNKITSEEIKGVVQSVNFKNGSQRALIEVQDRDYKVIAILKKNTTLKLSDEVVLRGLFLPLPPKVYPHFYDIELKARFNKVAGYFKIKSYTVEKQGFSILQKAREYTLSILGRFENENTKSIAVALLLGDKGLISKQDYSTFKKAGLAHILAISGLHLTIVCVLIFGIFFRVLAFTPLSLRVDTKKIAGIMGLFFGLFYLLLAGIPVSGLRSFLMVLFLFLGYFINGASGVRSLAIALLFILIFWPEEAFFPSFQLSFASVLCLLTVLRLNSINKILKGAVSSFLVTIVTIPFVVHHFGYVHFYGVFSNIVAIPWLTFVVMPFAIASFSGFAPFIMGFELSIKALFFMANFVANLPFSSIFLPYFNGYLLTLYSLFIIFALCFKNKKIKITAFVCLFTVILIYFLTASRPFLVVNNKYAVLKDGESYVSLTTIPEGFLKSVWEEKLNAKFIPLSKAKLKHIKCDEFACYSISPNFTIIFGYVNVLQACTSGVLVNLQSNNKDFNCTFNKTITLGDLKQNGQEPFIF
jgi:competence protein ComEC